MHCLAVAQRESAAVDSEGPVVGRSLIVCSSSSWVATPSAMPLSVVMHEDGTA